MPRNQSGTYALPLPPVVANTTIDATWANTTDDDMASALTDSLSRTGKGGMAGPFKLVDGTVGGPGMAFDAEVGTGVYRESAGVMAFAIQGAKVSSWSSAGLSILTGKVINVDNTAPISVLTTTSVGTEAKPYGFVVAGAMAAGTRAQYEMLTNVSNNVLAHGAGSAWTEQRFYTGGVVRMVLNAQGALIINGFETGWRPAPRVDMSNGTFDISQRGKTIAMGANNTVPGGVFSAGDVFWVQNSGAGDVRLLAGGGMTVRDGGTASVNNVALRPWGNARVWFLSSSECVVSGNTN